MSDNQTPAQVARAFAEASLTTFAEAVKRDSPRDPNTFSRAVSQRDIARTMAAVASAEALEHIANALDTKVENGQYVAIDLTANNSHIYPDADLGWGVCRHGHGLQAFGDGYMTEPIARARAAVLNAGLPATTVANI